MVALPSREDPKCGLHGLIVVNKRAAHAAVRKGMAEVEKHNGELRALPRPDRVKWLPRKTFGGGAPPSRLR